MRTDAPSPLFASPREAVELVNRLVAEERWRELLAYYHPAPLHASAPDPDIRAFFVDDSAEGAGHPAGFRRRRRPFPHGFEYRSHRALARDLVEVEVTISIPQGAGDPDQVGFATFAMRRWEEGYGLVVGSWDASRPTPTTDTEDT